VTPIDPNWGFERGTPIDRVYVEEFVGSHAADIRGRVLEIAAPDYTTRFGTGVERSDILMATEGNPQATIVGDLADAPHIPDDTFDCAIVTQTLQFVYDVRAALATLHRILKPGGVLLATVPGITKLSPPEDEEYGEWWHYTRRSALRLAEEAFGTGNVVCAFCHFGVDTVVGDNNFLSAYNSFDHHNRLGSDSSTGPACATSGLVELGDRVRLGTGIYVEPHVHLGDDVQVASGSVIVASVPAGHTVKRRVVTTAVVPPR